MTTKEMVEEIDKIKKNISLLEIEIEGEIADEYYTSKKNHERFVRLLKIARLVLEEA